MPLESASYIDQLEPNNPASGDPGGSGDDHLRMFKGAVKNSLPNIGGPVTLSHTQINSLPQDIADAVAALRSELLGHLVPTGVIALWSGPVVDIPSGWALCDGTNGTEDLRDRFVVGAGGSYGVNAAGGAVTKSTGQAGAHDHGGSTAGHALALAEIPSHSHNIAGRSLLYTVGAGAGSVDAIGTSNKDSAAVAAQAEGGGSSHSHNLASDGGHAHNLDVRPPYYAKAFIQKVSVIS